MNRRKSVLVSMTVILIVLALVAVGIYARQEKNTTKDTTEQIEEDDDSLITYNGKKYKYNTDIKTILFLGVDRSEKVEVDSQPGEGGQADTILLLLLDQTEKKMKVMEQ